MVYGFLGVGFVQIGVVSGSGLYKVVLGVFRVQGRFGKG